MYKKIILFTCFILFSVTVFSQLKKKYKYELVVGMGPTGFLGDLGGSYNNGTHFVKDYNVTTTRFCLNAGIRYKPYGSRFAAKATLSYATVSGSDDNSKDVIRQNRNLNFKSSILELAVQGEFYLINDVTKNRYTISGLHSRKKKTQLSIYVLAGVGVFYYNPQEEYKGSWYSVKKYHTEGQGMPGGAKNFSNYSVALPIGIGYREAINKRFSIGFEFGIRKTFTDYIDGVSGNYYEGTKLTQMYGPTAAALADPNLGRIDGATMAGQQRGNPKYKDSYMFLTINVGYKLVKKPSRTRAKF
ncbi:MAG TPA: DUF6089 family protein [Bacteroidia bacterium]|nr:DUF6089 family protein [Bacteroidia bacterium]